MPYGDRNSSFIKHVIGVVTVIQQLRMHDGASIHADEEEFLSPYAYVSLACSQRPSFVLKFEDVENMVDYDRLNPPVSFWRKFQLARPSLVSVELLIIESLSKFHYFLVMTLKLSVQPGSGQMMNLWDVSADVVPEAVETVSY